LDTSAPDYVAPIGAGTCQTSFKNVCTVACPQGVRPETSCVDYATPQKSANGCVVSQMPGARLVTYDEPGFQEWFRLPEDTDAPGCQEKDHMDSWWVPCTGPPKPVNCEGTWGPDGGWGECVSEGVCEVQTQKTRTFTRTLDAKHGGTCNFPADEAKETSVVGCPLLGPCCEIDMTTRSLTRKYKQAQDNAPPTCVQEFSYPIITEVYPNACAAKAEKVPGFSTTGTMACCIGDGDWTPAIGSPASITDMSVHKDDGGYRNCDNSGKMTQTQAVYGQCNAGASERDNVDCEYRGPWNKEGGDACPDDGIHRWNRVTVNSSAPTTKTKDCKYEEEWLKSGECASDTIDRYSTTVKGKQWYTRGTAYGGVRSNERYSKDCKVQQQVKSCSGGSRKPPTPFVCNIVWRDKPNPNNCVSRPGGGCNYPPQCWRDGALCPEKTLCKNSEGTWVDC